MTTWMQLPEQARLMWLMALFLILCAAFWLNPFL